MSFNAPATVFYNPFVAKVAVASSSYVTGSHSIKLGMQDKFGWIKNNLTQNGNMVQVYNNGMPLQVRVYNTPIVSRSNLNGDVGIYLQDSLEDQETDPQPGHPVRTLQRRGRRPGRACGPLRASQALLGYSRPAEFQELGAARRRRLRPVFGDGKTGTQGQRRPLHAAGCDRLPSDLQPDGHHHRESLLDRC